MQSLAPIITLSLLLAAALAGGMIAHRLKQPIMLGYLIIGIIAGPHALGWVSDISLIEMAASIGVALLMFTMGLEISLSQLRETGRIGIWGGLAQIAATLALGTVAGLWLFRWPLEQSVLFGLMISLSSTAVCLKILMDRGELSSVQGRIMVSFLILQDVSVVAMMIVLPVMGGSSNDIWLALGLSLGKAILFIGIALVLGQWVLPWLFGDVGGVRSRELFLLTILVLCLGATIGTQLLGLSMVFGAFLIAVVLRSTRFVHQALAEITPLRDIFATLFFVSIGMLLDPVYILNNWATVLSIVALIIIIKLTVVFGIVRAFGYNNRIAVLTGAGLFQIGEFSFVLAQGGMNEGLIPESFYCLMLSSTVATMILTPLSIALASSLYPKITSALNRRSIAQEACRLPADEEKKESGPVIIAGYGRTGENLARCLADANIPFRVIDIDSGCIASAKKCSMPGIYGDATNPLVLAQADLCNALALVITFPDHRAVEATAKNALAINPQLQVLARFHRERDAKILRDMGVAELVNPESEASFKFLKQVLKLSGIDKQDRKEIVDLVRQGK